ncbi:MAG: uracil-DNA glycosylase family protein [Desulfosporosinus sp.]|nr:uracil-DNA glycosylase family protein [Desulfosporosinus sp.]
MSFEGCKKCSLCNNQSPLVDKRVSADIMWVGLSAKKVEDIGTAIPLSNDTNSGKLIDNIESGLDEFRFIKANLVKCLPLDEHSKLRYPTTNEMKACYSNLKQEINKVKPKIVFLLGMKVSKFILKDIEVTITGLDKKYDYAYFRHKDIYYVSIHHPSYIHIYRRKQIDQYIFGVQSIINEVFNINLTTKKDRDMEIA